MNHSIVSLLDLQEKDSALAQISAKLKLAPLEIADIKREIAKIETEFETCNTQFKALEQKASQMRALRREIEAKIAKYRTQLLETKKNDEYLALNNEINRMVENVSAMETDELQTMMDVDSGRENLDAQKAQCTKEITVLNGKIWAIEEQIARLESSYESAKETRDESAKLVPQKFLKAYQYIKNSGKKFPIVVKFDGEKCCGCFLKITGDIPEKLDTSEDPVLCDQCGRILYK